MFGSRLRAAGSSAGPLVGGDGYHCAVAPPSTDPASEQPRRLFILDGHSLAYRAFFALPSTLATTTGQVTNAVYGFTSMLIKLLAEERPDLIAVAFDVGKPTARLAMDADYKAGRRETPEDFRPQLGLIQEVVEALRIPMLLVTDHEADDAIGTLAVRAAAQGIEATIVTADRDFFQLVRPGLRVLFNRRGISDIALMDEAAVEERFGLPPSKYLEYVALKGDTSDNIPGVPGVGEKTAAKLVQEFGSVEELLARTDELKGKLKENIEAAGERLALNKNLARIVTDVDLDVEPEDAVMGEWDVEEVRRLFTSLEFRSLFDRLMELAKDAKPKVEVAELDLRQVEPEELAEHPRRRPRRRRRSRRRPTCWSAWPSRPAARRPPTPPSPAPARSPTASADPATRKWTHDAKALERVTLRAGALLDGVAFDTMLAGYLLEPGTADYPVAASVRAVPRDRPLRSRRGGEGGRGAAVHRGSLAARGVRGGGRGAPRARSWRSRSTGRACGRSSRTWSCRSPPSSPGWRHAGSGSTSRTSRRWASPSATGWPPSTPRCSGTRGRSST